MQTQQTVCECLVNRIKEENELIEKESQETLKYFEQKPQNIEELEKYRSFAETELPIKIESLNFEINQTMEKQNLLEDLQYQMNRQDFIKTWESYKLPYELEIAGDQFLKSLRNREQGFSDGLMKQKDDLLYDLNQCN